MTTENFPPISFSEDPAYQGEQYGRDYELDGFIAVGGISTAIAGFVRHEGDCESLGLRPDGPIMADVRAKLGDSSLTPDRVHQWRVDVSPGHKLLLPVSFTLHVLGSGDDKAAMGVIREAIGYYQEDDGQEQDEASGSS